MSDRPTPLLIALPHGLNASGVTLWAVRLVNALARTGRACGLIVHHEPPGQRPLDLALEPGVDVFDARALDAVDTCEGQLETLLPAYRHALGVMLLRAGAGPVALSPNLLGDCYGLCVALGQEKPGLVRTFAAHHSDIAYNDLVCRHYQAGLDAFVGVSSRITDRLRSLLPDRKEDICEIPYGVEVPAQCAGRERLMALDLGNATLAAGLARPVRLVYTGRLDHEQKRIGALIEMYDCLVEEGLACELVLLGDGPASAEVQACCATRPGIQAPGAVEPDRLVRELGKADFFVLGSRYEGLSVSLLEAMARGCIPVLTPSESGTAQLVIEGKTGFLAQAGPEASPAQAGRALAAALARALACPALEAMREDCRAHVAKAYSMKLCAARYGELIDRIARNEAHIWPADKPAAFTAPARTSSTEGQENTPDSLWGSGTVPASAQTKLSALLDSLAGRTVAIYGTGRHTLELAQVFADAPVTIAAFYDDDIGREGQTLWECPIITPTPSADHAIEKLRKAGVTDLVISSWLHCQTMWTGPASARAAELGLVVHRLYNEQSHDGVFSVQSNPSDAMLLEREPPHHPHHPHR